MYYLRPIAVLMLRPSTSSSSLPVKISFDVFPSSIPITSTNILSIQNGGSPEEFKLLRGSGCNGTDTFTLAQHDDCDCARGGNLQRVSLPWMSASDPFLSDGCMDTGARVDGIHKSTDDDSNKTSNGHLRGHIGADEDLP